MIQWPTCVSQWIDNKLQDWQRKWFLPETWRALHHFEWTTWSRSKWQRGQITDSSRLPTAAPPSVKCKKWTFDGAAQKCEGRLWSDLWKDSKYTTLSHFGFSYWLTSWLQSDFFVLSFHFCRCSTTETVTIRLVLQCKKCVYTCVHVSPFPHPWCQFSDSVCEPLLVFVLYNLCLCSSAC